MKKPPASLSRRLDALGATITPVPAKGAFRRYLAERFKNALSSATPGDGLPEPAQLVSKRRRAKTNVYAYYGIRTGRQWRKFKRAMKAQGVEGYA